MARQAPRDRTRPRRPPRGRAAGPGPLYGDEVRRPLASLLFLSPALVFYAVGLVWVRPDLAARADLLLRQALAPLGVTGTLAPTWLVVGVLMAWHLVRHDPWRVSARTLLWMAVETALLVVPLVLLAVAVRLAMHSGAALAAAPSGTTATGAVVGPVATAGTVLATRGTVGGDATWLAPIMVSIGAGIYEELLFRLLMVGGTLGLARRLLGRESPGVAVAVVLVTAGVFAGAHTLDDPNRFAWDAFLFRSAAGTYLGFLFIQRGFGVAAGVHIGFDLLLKAMG